MAVTVKPGQMEEGERYRITYRCRDIGFGVEEGEDTFLYEGVESFGKRQLQPINQGPTVYLFDDEIVSIEENEAPSDVWAYAEEAPVYATAVSELWHWSTNYDAGKGPITLFLDLTGWSAENIGSALYDMDEAHRTLGYVELDKLAKALTEYADRPTDVMEWLEGLLSYEGA